jgi:hypothetical protein
MEDYSFLIEILLIILAFFCFGIWYAVDSYLISRYEGKIKRGIKIWHRELPYESRQFLLNLKNDVIEYRKLWFSEYKSAFIRVQNDEALIFSPPEKFRSSWPYVGYVDLTSPSPELEYRASLPGLMFLISFTFIGVLIFIVNYIFQTRAIFAFLEKKTSESASLKSRIPES